VIGFFNTIEIIPREPARSTLTLPTSSKAVQEPIRSGIPHPRGASVRRDQFVEPYFQAASPTRWSSSQGRKPARIMIAIGNPRTTAGTAIRPALGRPVHFYVNDRHGDGCSWRVSPYFPFSARVCLNQHTGGERMRAEGLQLPAMHHASEVRKPDGPRAADSLNSRTSRAAGRSGSPDSPHSH